MRRVFEQIWQWILPKKLYRDPEVFWDLQSLAFEDIASLSQEEKRELVCCGILVEVNLLSNILIRADGQFWKIRKDQGRLAPIATPVLVDLANQAQVKVVKAELQKDQEFLAKQQPGRRQRALDAFPKESCQEFLDRALQHFAAA